MVALVIVVHRREVVRVMARELEKGKAGYGYRLRQLDGMFDIPADPII
jgi:hypothetical protein